MDVKLNSEEDITMHIIGCVYKYMLLTLNELSILLKGIQW